MNTYYYIGYPDGYLVATKDRNNQQGIHAFSNKADAIREAQTALIEWCKIETGGSDVDSFVIYTLKPVTEVGLSVRPELVVYDLENELVCQYCGKPEDTDAHNEDGHTFDSPR